VLLIIFVITTPLLNNGMPLKLPENAGNPDKPIRPEDIRTVDITPTGIYALKGQPMKLDQVIQNLTLDHRANPALVVYIRADESSRHKEFAALLDGCQRNGLTRISVRTQPK
jgi:biopolymer transport protein ExbD